jgi:hypothetical protein
MLPFSFYLVFVLTFKDRFKNSDINSLTVKGIYLRRISFYSGMWLLPFVQNHSHAVQQAGHIAG